MAGNERSNSTNSRPQKGYFARLGDGLLTWGWTVGKQYKILYKTANRVHLMDMSLGKNGAWIARLDRPHGGADFNHLNINPRISQVKDPHLKIGGDAATLNGIGKGVKTFQYIGKGLVIISIVSEAYTAGCNVNQDYTNGTSRNTVEGIATSVGSLGGASAGGASGAMIGSMIFPGIGTVAGGIIGGMAGAITGSVGTNAVANYGFDKMGYNIDTRFCNKCKLIFTVRLYEKDVKSKCPKCNNEEIHNFILEKVEEDPGIGEENVFHCSVCNKFFKKKTSEDEINCHFCKRKTASKYLQCDDYIPTESFYCCFICEKLFNLENMPEGQLQCPQCDDKTKGKLAVFKYNVGDDRKSSATFYYYCTVDSCSEIFHIVVRHSDDSKSGDNSKNNASESLVTVRENNLAILETETISCQSCKSMEVKRLELSI